MNYGLWTLSRDCVLHNKWKQQIGITSLPILMQNCSGGDGAVFCIIPLSPYIVGRQASPYLPWRQIGFKQV